MLAAHTSTLLVKKLAKIVMCSVLRLAQPVFCKNPTVGMAWVDTHGHKQHISGSDKTAVFND